MYRLAKKYLNVFRNLIFCFILLDLSESEYQHTDFSSTHQYSFSSPPLSNVKSESVDLIDCASPTYSKQDSTMIISNYDKTSFDRSSPWHKTTKNCSNFSIEYILSTSFQPPTYDLLRIKYRHISSIFSKKKTKHFSDNYLHQIIHYRKPSKQEKKSHSFQNFNRPREILIRYILDLYNDFIIQKNQIKNNTKPFSNDALEQLADIACKLDTRNEKSILNQKLSSSKTNELLSQQCYMLIKQIYRKYQYKKLRKRLHFNPKTNFKDRCFHFILSIINILQTKKNIQLYGSRHSNCHILMSNIQKKFIDKTEQKMKIKQSICTRLNADQLTSNLEILVPNNGLLYEAVIKRIDSFDDLLLVKLHHERQTYLIPVHDLCLWACPKIVPENFDNLSKGSRVCAYWSTSLRGLHPAIVNCIPLGDDNSSTISLLFDDGDTGLIKLDEIRLLPDNYDAKGMFEQF